MVVPFPFADQNRSKRRPALVISPPALTERYGLYWLLQITSAKNHGWADDVPIEDMNAAGLPAPSVVRIPKLATVDEPVILDRKGRLAERDREAVAKVLLRYWPIANRV
ncbi:type II toxin-antitoxin system PemK/MazF family toxin [Ferruginivarius sediminum]|uniref:type II toxin-antitoxin system PemK/MazF family toxin n=1 Tax=Ferruginivarius sediminum TaxID=2661937 RepID=UPI001F4E0035|nr:type II toxin-antitoxin system PemK/MazF family toxin [Ferruginivarius sediminum]